MLHGLLALLLIVFAFPIRADDPEHGLLWNKTGLPAIFPLQVKTGAGVDTQVTLVDAAEGTDALSAFIEGGRFFQVLVPPGTYVLEFVQWDGSRPEVSHAEPPPSRSFVLDRVLTFEVRDGSVKAGHVVDLTDLETGIMLADRFVCQRYRVDRPSRPLPPFDDTTGYATRLLERGEIAKFPNRRSPEGLAEGVTRPVIETDFAPYFSRPEFKLRANPC